MLTHRDHSPALSTDPKVYAANGWTIRHFATATSTNLLAAKLQAWTAVRADTQTSGRGRFQRHWVSDKGGLWLSAVLPVNPASTRVLPFAVGLAVCDALREFGVNRLRMRWPNDVMVDDRKLAGLLVDQFTPGLAVAGIGINVFNRPEAADVSLKNHTIRLADVLLAAPDISSLTDVVLYHLRQSVMELNRAGFDSLLTRLNRLWGAARRVELDLDGQLRRGVFAGIDQNGRLILRDGSGAQSAFAAHHVRHLQEIS
jgi:BirA family transcriptional regulator, biotin operon repressor / biotin---[acetyl-CoA-carboxylase] ligase